MDNLRIEIPDSVLLATGQSREEFIKEAKLIIASKLFADGRISSGKAAEICGIARAEFLLEMGRRKIPIINLDEAELDAEFNDG